MKILLIHYAYWITGGPERYLFNIKKQLEDKGHKVIPFSMNCKENFNTPYSKYFISSINSDNSWYFAKKTFKLASSLKQMGRLFYSVEVKKNLTELIKNKKPDIAYVLLFHRKLSPTVLNVCALNKIPVVMRISDYLFMCPNATFYRNGNICELCKKSKLFSIKNKCIKDSLSASTLWYVADKFHHMSKIYDPVKAYILTNPFMRDKLIEYGYSGNYHVIESFATNNQKYMKTYTEKYRSKQLCYIGNIFEHKGVDLLLKAFLKFRINNPDYRLIIMGNDFDHIIQDLMKNNSELFNNVEYHNHSSKTKVLEILSNSIYSFAPVKWYENLPNSIIESFSVGTPVIGTDIGSIKYMIKNRYNGFRFRYGNIQDFSKTISEAVSISGETYSIMQDNCINEIKVKYNQEIHYNKLLKVFESVMSKKNQKNRSQVEINYGRF